MTARVEDDFKDLQFLIVDDDPEVRRTIVEYLFSFGYLKILDAPSAEKALEILRREKIDLILSDWEMPGMSGIEFLRAIRAKLEWSKIPFIMVTSQVSQEKQKIEEAALAEVDSYIVKPFRAKTLKEKIGDILARRLIRKQMTALVVDDDPGVRGTVSEMVASMGYSPVLQAPDGLSAFQLLKKNAGDISLIVSDWEMPRMNGLDFLKKVRSSGRFISIPFVIITSQSSLEDDKVKAAIEANVDHYLIKPFSADAFRKRVVAVMKKAEQAHEEEQRIVRAYLAIEQGDHEYAEKIFSQIITKNPQCVRGYFGLAAVSLMIKPKMGFDEAIQHIKTGIRVEPKCDQGYLELAAVFEKAMSLKKAISALEEGLKQCPYSEAIYFQLGRHFVRQGKLEAGRGFLQQALEIDPDYAPARELLAQNRHSTE